jgi:hypothetical protein
MVAITQAPTDDSSIAPGSGPRRFPAALWEDGLAERLDAIGFFVSGLLLLAQHVTQNLAEKIFRQ